MKKEERIAFLKAHCSAWKKQIAELEPMAVGKDWAIMGRLNDMRLELGRHQEELDRLTRQN